jgi:GTPase SAR1 family protein
MIGTSERRTVEFLNWEARGRGYEVWPHPVTPEPLFAPFTGRPSGERRVLDGGRKESFLSSTVRRLSERLAPPIKAEEEEPEPERTPRMLTRGDLIELVAHLPPDLSFDASEYAGLFTSLSVCAEPLVFEILATGERITAQFVVSPKDEKLIRRQFEAHLPSVGFVPARSNLATLWGDSGQPFVAAVEFGLGREFMIPLVAPRGDPLVGLVGALSEIEPDEIALFQVIFTPTRFPWPESIVRSVSHADGSALFVNAPELFSGAKEKTAHQLFAAVVRVAARSPHFERSWEIACNIAGALGAYGSPRGNELVPLKNEGYAPRDHELDVLSRQTHRSGMILSAAELAGFVHLPSSDVRSKRLRSGTDKTRPAPASVRNANGLLLGVNSHAGIDTPVVLTDEVRVRHIHVIGASGTGKSTLLYNLIRQDLERGYGLSVLDPHGDLIDKVLGAIPDERMGDVVLLDPSDEESVIGFNVLAAHTDWEKNLLASDLVAVFRRLSSAWGDQLNSVLSNALLAFMESNRGGTLVDVRRFLLEPVFRADFLKSVRDPNVVYYWQRAFPALTGNKSVGPVVTRLDTFLSPKALRYMVAQKENKIDFTDIIGSGKIFLAKLSEGFIGKENSHLLGSFLVSKIQSAAMCRQRESEASRRYHTLYADEFHNFLTPSLAECISGVRKYRLGLVLAHQEMRQVERDPDVGSALLNAGTRAVFRVSDRDARALESGFSSFDARDIQNLETGRAICRVERSDCDFNLRVELPEQTDDDTAQERRRMVIAASRKRYGMPRGEIERALANFVETETPPQSPEKAEVAKPVAPATAATGKKSEPPPVVAERSVEASREGKSVVVEEPVLSLPMVTAVLAAKREEKTVVPVTDLGKGGAQHKAIQDRIKDAAEKLGFRVVVEQEFPGLGQIDLVIARDGVSIACEVTVTQTIDYEVGNVSKCLKAGFTQIAVVGLSDEKLGNLAAAVANSLGAEKAKCVSYFLPDAFISSLRLVSNPQPPAEPLTRTRGGRVVKRKVIVLSTEEAKGKEEQALRVMAAMMKSKARKE